ncbi:MAG: histidinol-phosphate transaminase [Coriobacteriia bacterium]|nr:histidinol-phosphate transaminase [Coriobacteriia bacterium]
MDFEALIRSELGPMVPYAPGLRASEVRERSGVDTIRKLSSNENPYGPFPVALDAMSAVLGRLNVYSDGSVRALRERLAGHLGVSFENVSVTNGSNELIRLIAQCVLRPGDEVVFAWPSFVVYPMVTQLMGATAVKVPLTDRLVHDLDAMLAAITDKTRLLFLCNPNNPTGTIYDAEAFDAFIAAVPHHVLVVLDEAYFEYVTDERFPNGLDYFDPDGRICVLRTFSKIYSLAGARVGYGALPTQMISAVDKVREPFNVNTVAQVGAFYSLSDQAEVRRRRQENQEQKTHLYSCFDRLGIGYAVSETNFVWMKTQRPAEVFEALLNEGIIVRDFGTAPALRVGVGTPSDTKATIAAIDATSKALGSF